MVAHSVQFDSLDILNRAIEEHYEEIKAALRRRGHQQDSASEIVHDLYLKFAENPDSLSQARSIRAFLSRAAVNLGIDRARRSGFEQRLFSGTDDETLAVAATTPAPDYGLEVQARLQLLKAAIGELPERRRAVFILHRLHQMSPDAIAAKLKLSRTTVDRHLRAALLHCLDRLAQID